MALTDKENARVKELTTDAADNKYRRFLNQWEMDFMNSLTGRYEKYGGGLLMSDKQWDCLNKIEVKMYKPEERGKYNR